MQDHTIFEQMRDKYADEDRAKLVMLQLRTLMEQKKKKKWYQKLKTPTKTQPTSWNE
ncbi:hypothetical protein GCM10008018_67430 [Paenibacillus marchantiophytorum]|uniref:Uncharacterized protein n=1 Tax=Paenibacillus marchantiophytorum TaxID=1619310 RepID=A0ABQ1FIT5_9BACL|nr:MULTISPECIES: hypothetical protein [Paenibacillus]UKS29963.1 hypothetical protein LOZ80_13895 [Paenibacillus sp. HWE-109]GGA12975.1 hypothetical protein GCM10008018_67430 [Paenibacillus marchantiophytorum]